MYLLILAFAIATANGKATDHITKYPTEYSILDPVKSLHRRAFRSATIEEFPYQVSIESFDKNIRNYTYVCGGGIISSEFVLTAGHCVKSRILHDLKIRAGSSIRNRGGCEHQVEKVIIHEDFLKFGKPLNDVALLKVTPPFHLDDTCQPIKLYESDEKINAGEKAVASGWGYNVHLDNLPLELQAVNVSVIDVENCKESLKSMSGVFDGQICAKFQGQSEKYTCHVDSGNPMAVDGKLAGIVSWGYKCWRPELPTVYSEVSYFREWIKTNSGV